jgi:hypothetical protein
MYSQPSWTDLSPKVAEPTLIPFIALAAGPHNWHPV